MRFIFLCLITVWLLSLSSCTKKGFNREILQNYIRDKPTPIKTISEDDIKNAIDGKQEIVMPFKLAICFPEYKYFAYGTHNNLSLWKWSKEDKDKILETTNNLSNKDAISKAFLINYANEGHPNLSNKKITHDTFIINDVVVSGELTKTDKVKAIRLAAAQAGADKVLIINGIFDMDFYGNGLGFTYVLLVTAFFVPGTISHGLFMVNATLWDVREPIQYFSIETEGMTKQIRPKALIGKGKLINKSKAIALDNLQNDLGIRLNSLKSKE